MKSFMENNLKNKVWKACLLLLFGSLAFSSNAQITIDFEITSPTCHGYTNGSITANPQGGTSPYQYFWSNGQAGQSTFGVGSGNYSVTVSDADGITAVGTTFVDEPAQLEVNVEADGDICQGVEGSFTANVNGGQAPFSFQWSHGPMTQTVENLIPGYYFVTVTDVNGCKAIGGIGVNNPLSVEVVTIDVVCYGWCDGSSEAIVSGGIGPYTYVWNNGSTEPIQDMLPIGEFIVTVTDGNGCTAVGSGIINEPPELVLDIELTGQCNGDGSIDITPSGGIPPYNYQWGHGPTSSSLDNLGQGTYFLTVSDANECKADTFFIISNGAVATITNNEDASCEGVNDGSATVTIVAGVGPFTVKWSTDPPQSTETIENLAPGTYYVTVTDDANCSTVDSVQILSGSDFELVLSSTPANCSGEGGTATVDEIIGGNAPFTYQWGTDPIQTGVTAENLAPGTYDVVVTDSVGCESNASVEVGQDEPLSILVQIENTNCEDTAKGSITVVQVGPDATLPLTYSWCHDDMEVDSIAGNLSTGFYCLTITDANGCSGTVDSMFVDFDSAIDPQIGWDVDTCMGDSILITFVDNSIVSPSSANIIEWVWSFNNGLSSNESSVQFYTNMDTIIADLIVTNALGCVDTTSEMVVFNLACDIYPDSYFVCQGDTLEISPNGTCDDIIAYNWQPDSLIVSGGDTDTPQIIGGESDFTLQVEISNTLGCSFIDEVLVMVTDTSKQLSAEDIEYTQCDSTTVDFTVDNSDVLCYSWVFDYPDSDSSQIAQNPSFTYTEAGTYTVALIPSVPCLDTVFKEIIVDPSPIAAFEMNLGDCSENVELQITNTSVISGNITETLWVFSNGDSSTMENPIVSLDSCQNLGVELLLSFEPNCTISTIDNINISVFQDPPMLGDTLVVCMVGDTIRLNSNPDSSFIYQWSPTESLDDPSSPNPLATIDANTVYTVTISDDSCGDTCTVIRNVTVLTSEPINLELPEDIVACEETTETLTASTEVPAVIEWSLYPDFSELLQSSGDLVLSDDLEIVITDTMYVYTSAVDEYGCRQVDSLLLGNYEILAQPPSDFTLCFGDTFDSLSIVGLTGVDTLHWFPDDPTGTVPVESGSFSIEIVNDQGCTLTQELELFVQNIDEDFQVTPRLDTILLGQSVDLSATFNPNYVYQWGPTDGLDDPTSAEPTATPSETTSYTVQVMDITTECRGAGSSTICVIDNICDEPMIFVPNVFTPNGDGLNDEFRVRGFNIDELELVIFNRWGQKVFESRTVEKAWDGTFEGNLVSGDVYGYYLRVNCISGGNYSKKGNVTVIR